MACFFKDLTKKEKKHLKKTAEITTLAAFKEMAEKQAEMRKEYKEKGGVYANFEPCYDCKNIARKLGLEV